MNIEEDCSRIMAAAEARWLAVSYSFLVPSNLTPGSGRCVRRGRRTEPAGAERHLLSTYSKESDKLIQKILHAGIVGLALLGAGVVRAEELPDAPEPAAAGQSSSVVVNGAENPPVKEHQDPQTKRILYIFPNFRSVSAATQLPPQSVHEKFVTATEDSFDYSAFVLPLLLAGYGQKTNQYPEFHQGAAGYARYFWHTYTDQTIENYMVEFVVPVATREDTRYYTLGHGGFLKRTGYALSRAVVTRTDSNHRSFNYSEVVGAGAAAGISNLYYPTRERTLSNTMDRWGTNVGIDAGTFVIREFWPDVNHFLFHGKTTMQSPQ